MLERRRNILVGPRRDPAGRGTDMKQLLETPQRADATADCRHHWVIEPPAGATRWGVCKRSGAAREFYNAVADFPWEEEREERVPRGISWVREGGSRFSLGDESY